MARLEKQPDDWEYEQDDIEEEPIEEPEIINKPVSAIKKMTNWFKSR